MTIDIVGHELNEYIAAFLIPILQKEAEKYSYARKWSVNENMKHTQFRVPERNGSPDWEFTENYMKALPYSDRISI